MRNEPTPERIEVDRVARMLFAEWKRVDPRSNVALYPTSYMANFADMARVVIADRVNGEQAPAEILAVLAPGTTTQTGEAE